MVNVENFKRLSASCTRYGAQLVAVSKFKSTEDIMELYRLGQRDFAENYVQELLEKQAHLPGDIRWHFIGSLQRNKVKYIAPFIHLIHSVDSFRLLKEINKQGAAAERQIPCLLQLFVAQEETKSGMSETDLAEFIEFYRAQEDGLQHVRLEGVMGMASFTDDQDQIRREFREIRSGFSYLRSGYFLGLPHFKEISMGMSNDYPLALEEGSTIIRVGSLLFGKRDAVI